jgi:hypothetical protein
MRSAIDRGRRIPPRPAHFRRGPESDFLRIKLAANRPNPQFGAFLRCHKACEIGRAGPDCDHLSAELQRRKQTRCAAPHDRDQRVCSSEIALSRAAAEGKFPTADQLKFASGE